jgi:hypothetical protein
LKDPIPINERFSQNFKILSAAPPLGQISLAVTTLFWGIGATLQFIIEWLELTLGMNLLKVQSFEAIVAFGVAVVQCGQRIPRKFAVVLKIWASLWDF